MSDSTLRDILSQLIFNKVIFNYINLSSKILFKS